MWRYRSFALAIAAALVLSPIVWLDYFALAALPLALARPRLSAIWFLPIATWGLEGAGIGIGDVSDIARLLLVFAVVFGSRSHTTSRAWRATGAGPARRPLMPQLRSVDHPRHDVRRSRALSTPGGTTARLSDVAALVGLVALPLLLYIVMLQTFWEQGELGIDLTQTLLPAAREIADGSSPVSRIRLPAARRIRSRPADSGAVPGARLDRALLLVSPVACGSSESATGAATARLPLGRLVPRRPDRERHDPAARLDGARVARRETRRSAPASGADSPSRRRSSAGRSPFGSRRRRLRPRRRRRRRRRGDLGLWGLLGFSGLLDYPSSLDKLETAQARSSYTVRALLEDLGVPGSASSPGMCSSSACSPRASSRDAAATIVSRSRFAVLAA